MRHIDYGVVKMNIDTDTQYVFTRPIADHMFRNYDGVLKVDGEVGNKKSMTPVLTLPWQRLLWLNALSWR